MTVDPAPLLTQTQTKSRAFGDHRLCCRSEQCALLASLAAALALATLLLSGGGVWPMPMQHKDGSTDAPPKQQSNGPAARSRPAQCDDHQGVPPPAGTPARLTLVNGCETDDLWVTGFAVATPVFDADVRLRAGCSIDVDIPDGGLASTRFWAKWSCNAAGQDCRIGQSGGPGESCGEQGCAPPVDSKFEATFGCLPDAEDCALNPSGRGETLSAVDWWDVSQVDGWTLPYRVDVYGDCLAAKMPIDCSSLALSACPDDEDLGGNAGRQSLALRDPRNASRLVGCYSPCAKLTYSQWNQGFGNTPESPQARDFCCPTPPVSPAQCSAGPVASSRYVRTVHALCPSVYGFAYDDGVGLAQCPAGTRYKVTFYCPK